MPFKKIKASRNVGRGAPANVPIVRLSAYPVKKGNPRLVYRLVFNREACTALEGIDHVTLLHDAERELLAFQEAPEGDHDAFKFVTGTRRKDGGLFAKTLLPGIAMKKLKLHRYFDGRKLLLQKKGGLFIIALSQPWRSHEDS